ncbi:MAG: hypothetical protein DRI69_10405 [Bacteroidetes bacterium]|nr:MAG: hypothetical protein DRI69_10405 [Bacteroidota bacterium]
MAILGEDVLIRIITDTNKGVADLKKAGGATDNLMKSALKMATAMGGAALAVELVVKSMTALIKYAKDSEKEYVKLIKASDDYAKGVYTEVDAIDDLEAAKLRMKQVNGELVAQSLEGVRSRRAESIELRIAFREQSTFTEAVIAGGLAFFGSTIASKAYKRSIIDSSEALEDHVITLEEQLIALDALAARSAALDALYGGTGLTLTTKDLTEELRALASQFGLLSEAEAINYSAEMQLLKLDELLAANAGDNISLLAAEGFTYAELSAKILETRDAQLALLKASKEVVTDLPKVAEVFDEAFGPDVAAERVAGFNALGGAITGFLNSAFGDSKAAASVMAAINTALAITNVLANIIPPFNFIAAAAVGAAGLVQVAKINGASFADGTPPGGYTVPPGYNDDSFPVSAKSGETVNISRAGESGGGTQIVIMLDSQVLADVTTDLIANRKIVIRQGDLLAS